MKKILQYLFEHKTLSREQAKEILTNISNGHFSEHEVTAFITVFLMRSVTIEELQGFRDALLGLCVKVDLGDHKLIDIVGTGGDGKNTFNISTLACFIVAGAGQKVAKHGNYGATSISGASNVMEQLGYTFKSDAAQLKKEVEEAGICFLHAPVFHPALKSVGPIRKNLGLRTFFNILGPMVNPASPAYQLVGVYNLEMARVYNYLLQQSGNPFAIIHSLDGYDEISLTADTKVITHSGEAIMTPEQLGKRQVAQQDIYGGNTPEEACKIFKTILKGEGSWAQNAVVLANAAMALHCTGNYATYNDAYVAAVDSLESGKANACLTKLIALQ
ncbi:anthranilate phosphoribosyltransferase [Filimonas lacunae]|uniref:Anthranilate phosphoribosyltransferase n=1 Tax=Filimonas lacunae TaxID=477680 RepID=A0A173ML12_9BACT|nr:anthranilate phosphoribosyltransferase [Filimonas lacunae]BAV08159.1 anthranilate phosphoribosyltransferase [Filimonas lacunae]SIT10131.1 anthranilate phosphoribosyltransferase [Filimonas lacunae]